MKRLLLATTALVAFAAGAQAADLGVPRSPVAAAVVAPAFNWTGFYLGGHLGYGFGRGHHANTPLGAGGAFDNGPDTTPFTYNTRGVLGGVHAGYNWQTGSLVVGIEGELGFSGVSGRRAGAIPGVSTDDYGDTRFGFYGFIGPRLGFAVDRALLYVKAGLAVGTVRNTATDLLADPPPIDFDLGDTTRVTRTRLGWGVGAGIEYAFTRNWVGRLEYMYKDYGSFTSTNLDGDFFRHRNHEHSVRVGVSYLFSTGPSAVVARY
ncbi:outer membrane beta-barrel protein [Phreatobacter sp.]|uniref:outer membrane protein n=1 Tax=Phreatobacter sp. TaxID=1966341 RepID=UPI0022BBF05C|nr:outer membrane beta-barrel protein [Phreatobacter sp.]MCZ8316452.1 outer membrane beta-barrel protein [Phreatobacter sp.]